MGESFPNSWNPRGNGFWTKQNRSRPFAKGRNPDKRPSIFSGSMVSSIRNRYKTHIASRFSSIESISQRAFKNTCNFSPFRNRDPYAPPHIENKQINVPPSYIEFRGGRNSKKDL